MMFNSIRFVIFFAIVLVLLFFVDKTKKIDRNKYLLIASSLFYILFDWKCFILLLIFILFIYYIGLKVKNNKSFLIAGIAISTGILIFFKYFNFFIDSFSQLFGNGNTIVLNIIAPIGISFYVFKAISYLVDIYKGKITAEKDFSKVALYISFFPEIVAGPISKPSNLLSQFKEEKTIKINGVLEGAQIFLLGLFKKIVIADNISVFVNEIYRAPRIYSSITVLLCVVSYSIEIYMDFSGYSDMSIGCSKMLGYDIDKNFNLPYVSHNVTEFWKRWHISLSNWLMEYIYIPLGGNRKGPKRQYINLALTMVIGGLWHGANWTFVLWGFFHGLALVIHKVYLKVSNKKNGGIVSIASTFVFVSLMWVLFRADSVANAIDIYQQLFSFKNGICFISSWSIFGIIVVLVSTIIAYYKNNKNSYYPFQDLTTVKGLFLLFVFIGLIIGLAYTGSNPFIYAAF